MKLHPTVIEKILYLTENYGGHENNAKLREKITALELTPYERKTGPQDVVLVLTEDFMKSLGKQ